MTREDVEGLVRSGKWIFPGAGHERETMMSQAEKPSGYPKLTIEELLVEIVDQLTRIANALEQKPKRRWWRPF